MPKSCIICSAVASPILELQYCAACQSARYCCSRACQRIDWKKRHRGICKLLNVGYGDMQVRTEEHTSRQIELNEQFETNQRSLDDDDKKFFKLFEESTFEGSRAAARKMKQIAKRKTKHNQTFLLFHSVGFLLFSDSEMLSWPNSPLLVLLHFVDASVLSEGESRVTPLHYLTNLADPFDYSTHEIQLILAKQLVERGANVSAVSRICGETTLHKACYSGNVTNLDFVEFLLGAGADPNAKDYFGRTPLMYTIPQAPGAAKFLLNWPTTDANIAARTGESFPAKVREAVEYFSDKAARRDDPEQVQDQFQLQQWCEIEEMLVERGAADTGITTPE
jgi:hypothetical protein